jgi:hypothetical protein
LGKRLADPADLAALAALADLADLADTDQGRAAAQDREE